MGPGLDALPTQLTPRSAARWRYCPETTGFGSTPFTPYRYIRYKTKAFMQGKTAPGRPSSGLSRTWVEKQLVVAYVQLAPKIQSGNYENTLRKSYQQLPKNTIEN